MLDFVIFAVTFAVALIVAIIYLYPSSKRTTTIPGLDPSSKQDGNLADIIRAGSLHEFVLSLHQQYGPIASFWMGDTQIVSLASPQLIESNKKAFDRSSELYVLFEPLLGSQNLLYASGDEGRQRRSNFVNAFKDDMIAEHCTKLEKISSELMSKWSSMSEQHIPVGEHMMALAMRFQLLKTFGEYFEKNAEILKLRRDFDTCWNEFEKLLQDLAEPGSIRREAFNDAQAAIEAILEKAVENHRKKKSDNKKMHLLIDTLLSSKATDEQIITDCFLTVLFDFHTLGALLTWSLYFLATHADIQTKLYKEIKTLPEGEPTLDDLKKLKFLKQVLNETHRCAVLNQWSATSQTFDTEIGGHKIPKNTPIINAVGVLMQDEKYCSLPTQYDPDRFSDESLKSSSSSPAPFEPFAFADKRTRLANEHIQVYVSVYLVKVLREFRLSLVKGQVVTPVYGLVTHPDDEIWITATKRDKS